MPMRPHPQILHIGFSKCASTYLRALFRGHPRIHLVFKSGFFTPFIAHDMTFEQYQAHFIDSPGITNVESDEHLTLPGVHPLLGVRVTNLEDFTRVADKIRACLPDTKLVMVIRNQASLMVSRYSEYVITGGGLEFDEFADTLMGGGPGPNVHYQNYYFEIVRILEDRFPKRNLLLLLQEEMRQDTLGSAAIISRFIGLEDRLELQSGLKSERRSLSYRGMRLLAALNRHLVSRSSVGGEAPTTRIPQRLYLNMVRVIRALDYYLLRRFSPASGKVLGPERNRSILSHFRADNLRLQSHLGRDLTRLGYLAEI